jgi:acyl-[acyl-carrier-protein]-phospholipid O-acyltransferase/long-chain-fatty-acid--[acyl-carrier-protein] ligase
LGIGVAYRPSPLDLGAVSKMIRDYGVTFLPATPPILEEYTRGCSPEDFGSLEFIAAGDCPSSWRSPSKVVSAFGRSKATVRPNARPWSP